MLDRFDLTRFSFVKEVNWIIVFSLMPLVLGIFAALILMILNEI